MTRLLGTNTPTRGRGTMSTSIDTAETPPSTPSAAPDAMLTAEESRLLRILIEQDAPIGARAARRLLVQEHIDVSEATVSRIFARLDALGMTEPVGRKGRHLTRVGRRSTAAAIEADRRNDELERALDIRSEGQLLDLLHARRGVERELARAAARNRSDGDLEVLERAIAEQRQIIATGISPQGPAMHFHRVVAEMSGNDLLTTISDTLWSDTLLPLEKLLDIVTTGHNTVEHSLPEHESILAAIRDGDPDAAERAVDLHHSRLIDEVVAFSASDRSNILARLFLSLGT